MSGEYTTGQNPDISLVLPNLLHNAVLFLSATFTHFIVSLFGVLAIGAADVGET